MEKIDVQFAGTFALNYIRIPALLSRQNQNNQKLVPLIYERKRCAAYEYL